MRAIWSIKYGVFTCTEKLVLLNLADFSICDGWAVFPSLRTVSEETGLSEQCTKKTISTLQSMGVLEWKQASDDQAKSTYKIKLPCWAFDDGKLRSSSKGEK